MSVAVSLYSESLRRGADGLPSGTVARFQDGTTRPLDVRRWATAADAVDEEVLALVDGPVLDVGCGPGRHLHALARQGVLGLGVDLCPVAVELARGGGADAIVGSIFGEVPGAGQWRSALLLDGNIGIGGRPARLLQRIIEILVPGGVVLVELAPSPAATIQTMVRLETASQISDWFPWAEVSVASIEGLGRRAELSVARVWCNRNRWFALLTAC